MWPPPAWLYQVRGERQLGLRGSEAASGVLGAFPALSPNPLLCGSPSAGPQGPRGTLCCSLPKVMGFFWRLSGIVLEELKGLGWKEKEGPTLVLLH